MWLRLSSFNGRPHLYFFLIVPSLQISCFGKTKEKQYAKYYLNKRIAARLIWQLVIHSCVIFAYIISRRDGENNGFLAGVSLPSPSSRAPRVSLAPKTPFPFPFKRLPHRLVDSEFLELYSVFQNPGFPIPQTRISWILDSTSKTFLDSGIQISLDGDT